jgi:hypothetical protein
MNEDIQNIESDQHRTIQENVIISSGDHNLILSKKKQTVINNTGDITTTETRHIDIHNGEAIKDENQIVGHCQFQDCRLFLTNRTYRYCHECYMVLCPKHSKWDNTNGSWVCRHCLWVLRLKRLFGLEDRRRK